MQRKQKISKNKTKQYMKINIQSKKVYVSNQKAITLITLVVTIMVLLILAGITLQLLIGENGLIGRTWQARIKYDEQQAREKLEIVLLDCRSDKEVNSNYNWDDYLTSKLEENGIIVNGDIAVVDGWQFTIDRSIPKIGESLGKGGNNIISSPYIGTTSFTTKIEHIDKEAEVETYTYIIDEVEEITNLEKEYTKEGLEAESKHKVKVVIKYKDGTTLQSNTLNITLEPRTYLYNNGNQCIDITGGWKTAPISSRDGITAMNPKLTFKEDSMNLYLHSTDKGIHGGGLLINNSIDYTRYKKICFKITGTLSYYSSESLLSLCMNSQTSKEYLIRAIYKSPVTIKTVYGVNIQNRENIEDIFFYIQTNRTDGGGIADCNIYEVWLEK